jgi:hypothetical protein
VHFVVNVQVLILQTLWLDLCLDPDVSYFKIVNRHIGKGQQGHKSDIQRQDHTKAKEKAVKSNESSDVGFKTVSNN